jgi:UDP-GlcNAc:undecaprenyl-phosphate GlcNAc-1-phosphate transferase
MAEICASPYGQWLAVIFGLALVASLALTRVARTVATRLGITDSPDGRRKLHAGPIPLWGGVALYLSMALALVLARQWPELANSSFMHFTSTLMISSGLVMALGFVDDIYELRGRVKLAMQILAVVPLIVAGYWFNVIAMFGVRVELGWIGIPITVLWLVGCINAINLLDGMDGCASVAGIVAALAAGVVGIENGQWHILPSAAALAGGLIGFLAYNRPPASIYLGDSGSMVIGLVLGLLCLEGGNNLAGGHMSVAAPLVLMTIPLWDTSLAIVRRKLTGRRFDSPDRGHLHHRLQELGFSNWQALGVIAWMSSVAGGAAILAAHTGWGCIGWGTAAALVVLMAACRWFGHYEVALARIAVASMLARLANRLALACPMHGEPDRRAIARGSFDEAWRALIGELSFWEVRRLELRLRKSGKLIAAHVWQDSPDVPSDGSGWRFSTLVGTLDQVQCELYVEAREGARAREPWYVGRVGRVLRRFALRLVADPELVVTGDLKHGDQSVIPFVPKTKALRDAA